MLDMDWDEKETVFTVPFPALKGSQAGKAGDYVWHDTTGVRVKGREGGVTKDEDSKSYFKMVRKALQKDAIILEFKGIQTF